MAPDFNLIASDVANLDWPSENDPLFAPAPDGNHAAISSNAHLRLPAIISGYKQAADALVEAALTGSQNANEVVYPIVFLYRHVVELGLKYLISQYGPLTGVTANWNSHGLLHLWGTYRHICQKLDVANEDPTASAMLQTISAFDHADPGSFSFRYHLGRDGQPIGLRHHEIDLARLRRVMNGVDRYFSGSDSYLWEIRRYILDSQAEAATSAQC